MAKYMMGLTATERNRNCQRNISKSEQYLSETNQILHVFSVEYIMQTPSGKCAHVTSRAIANTELEVQALVRAAVFKSKNKLVEFVGTPSVIGKDRTWMSAGKSANKLGPRLTDEVMYAATGVR